MGSLCGGESGPAPVVVRIYDVSGSTTVKYFNKVFRTLGTGAFHAGVEVYGSEWSFGHTENGTGVFSCQPRTAQSHHYREAIQMGVTQFSSWEVQSILEDMMEDWKGREYDILRKNCCHFAEQFCLKLGVGTLPTWVMNMSGAGSSIGSSISALKMNVAAVKNAFWAPKAREVGGRQQQTSSPKNQQYGRLDPSLTF
eukprot:TRINITY_DN78276_c0_g1_i1.p1 TRINITY_DN78276_c0_g1~~TRINITY_DN78276_c0_g1_i1.p1  ORF type:complete len:197 (+),score=22.04 TRINITY_DN78276_c0_g1_i1:98-688(+)